MAGIYIHIPFCSRKCIYCDFYSIAPRVETVDSYLTAVGREYLSRIGELDGKPVSTLYVGGGTPSLLTVAQIQSLLEPIDRTNVVESTIEVNPDDVTPEMAAGLRRLGFNRVSMGIQSFDDAELALIGRRHNARKAVEAVEILRNAGFENISIDLIYGIPGQSLESFTRSVDAALNLRVCHISAYCMTYEEGTRLTRMRDAGKLVEVDDETCVAMYQLLVDRLKSAGYEHYEISNFALPGRRSQHNCSYWNFTPYLGLGASAHSFDGSLRRSNPASLRQYIQKINDFGVAYDEEIETPEQLYNEWIMTRLRTADGLDLLDVGTRWGEKMEKHTRSVLLGFENEGLVRLSADVASLTDRGVMLSDMIFRELFVV
ncbi:MAG: radical SAM family heme chaperone HemW [Bacteroidales bacterium]|nr:radical SAM family heme chaperone HemW [Bacteroidales bacterium]